MVPFTRWSKHKANVLKIGLHVHDVCSVCFMFASSCKRGITLFKETRIRRRRRTNRQTRAWRRPADCDGTRCRWCCSVVPPRCRHDVREHPLTPAVAVASRRLLWRRSAAEVATRMRTSRPSSDCPPVGPMSEERIPPTSHVLEFLPPACWGPHC